MTVEKILAMVEGLSVGEKVVLVDAILADPRVQREFDRLWGEEAERRIDACKAGEMESEPIEDAIAALRGLKRDGAE